MTSAHADLIATLPRPTEDSKPFWDGCNAEKLLLQHCGACRHIFYYARRLCPACGSSSLLWRPSSGRGKIYSFSEVHVPFAGPEWSSQLPYTIVLVDLDDGPRMLSRWHSVDGRLPATGERTRVFFPMIDGQKLPFFKPDIGNPQ